MYSSYHVRLSIILIIYILFGLEKREREKEKIIIIQEVKGFETTFSCYVESYLNKFVPHKTSLDVIVFNKKDLRIKI